MFDRRIKKSNDSFKKTKKEDFNNKTAEDLLATKPVVVKPEPALLEQVVVIPAVAEKPLMKPRVIKTKEQKEKDKKSNQLLAAHAISSQVINPGL